MSSRSFAPRRAPRLVLTALACLFCLSTIGDAQLAAPNAIDFHVRAPTQRLEMVVNSSRNLALDKKIPRAQVNNPEVVQLTPLSASQIQVSALKPGVTQVNLWDQDKNVYTVDIIVYADARELEMLLKAQFPKAALEVRPLNSSVVISGYVPRPDTVSRITQMAEDYYPKVINNITVGGVQQVLLQVKVMEVSRTKLRTLGIDWATTNGSDFFVSSVAGLIDAATASTGGIAGVGTDQIRFGILDGPNTFQAYLEALRQHNLVKVLAEPTLVTVSGRPASFNVGGEFPIVVPASLGSATIQFKEFGTRIDFVPIVLGNGSIRLEIRPTVSEVDSSRNVVIGTFTVPGLKTRWVDTAVEMQAGQTLALAGLVQEKVESETKGIPVLMELPLVGGAFRRVTEQRNEIELLIMVTPELVEALDPDDVPSCGPGRFTTSPNDRDFYLKGHLEVPKCCPDGSCPGCRGILPRPKNAPPGTESDLPLGAGVLDRRSTPSMTRDIGPMSRYVSQTPQPALSSTAVPRSRRISEGHTAGDARTNRYMRDNVSDATLTDRTDAATFQPRLIGPIGYDVQN